MVFSVFSHERYMKEALQAANHAMEAGEVPVGAIVVSEQHIVARAHNQVETLHDATAHAEMLAMSAAMEHLQSRYLNACTLYVTIEPCPMCISAMYWAQVGSLVYGAADPKRGYTTISKRLVHPKTKVLQGVEEAACADIITNFFTLKRKKMS